MKLTHYIIVRRDIGFGDVCAQIAHAAGESFYELAFRPGSSETAERSVFNGEVAGSIPAPGSTSNRWFATLSEPGIFGNHIVELIKAFSRVTISGSGASHGGSTPSPRAIPKPTAVVLGARNENRLLWLEKKLVACAVSHAAIRESEGMYAGQLMAIGLPPGDKEDYGSDLNRVLPYLNEFHMIKECNDRT